MPLHQFEPMVGSLETITIDSKALEGNLLGDPTRRRVVVYLPPGYHDSDERYPLFVDIVGFTGSGFSHLAWKPWQPIVPERLELLQRTGAMGKVVAAFPDCFTSLGGNQYIDSPVMGNWAQFLTDEMIPRLESEFRLLPGRQHRALFGKSSGGYGAIVHGLRYADHWGAVACHSGDMDFDLVYWPWIPKTLDALARHGGLQGFLEYFDETPKVSMDDVHYIMVLAMAATYDPDPGSPRGIRLPVDLRTCARDREAWQRWLAHDPVVLVDNADYQDNLRRLSGLYIDCGARDQYHLVYGARQFVGKLQAAGIPHTYHEFDDNHTAIDYRMDHSLPFLYHALMARDSRAPE